jgi:5-methylcytosine-specific restriction endonuclease McrA
VAYKDPERKKQADREYYQKNREKRKAASRRWHQENRTQALEVASKWRAENREQLLESKRRWYQENREQVLEGCRAWYEENRERVAEYQRVWYGENRDKRLEQARIWAQDNPHLVRKYNATRRALKLDQFIEEVDPQVVYQDHGGCCGICKEFIEGDYHIDHIVPLSKGGMHGYINVQPAHPVCNMRKGARLE